MNLNYNSQPH